MFFFYVMPLLPNTFYYLFFFCIPINRNAKKQKSRKETGLCYQLSILNISKHVAKALTPAPKSSQRLLSIISHFYLLYIFVITSIYQVEWQDFKFFLAVGVCFCEWLYVSGLHCDRLATCPWRTLCLPHRSLETQSNPDRQCRR